MLQSTRTLVSHLPPGVRQFLKFCTVGAVNTALDWGLALLLTYRTPIPRVLGGGLANVLGVLGVSARPETLAVFVTKVISSGTATCNSFIWNRRWTFRIRGKQERMSQFARFVAVNIIGMLLNSTITTLIVRPFLPPPPQKPHPMLFMAAQAVATLIVLFWNFFANKYWTFRNPSLGG
jgi:putative flippase GtrA